MRPVIHSKPIYGVSAIAICRINCISIPCLIRVCSCCIFIARSAPIYIGADVVVIFLKSNVLKFVCQELVLIKNVRVFSRGLLLLLCLPYSINCKKCNNPICKTHSGRSQLCENCKKTSLSMASNSGTFPFASSLSSTPTEPVLSQDNTSFGFSSLPTNEVPPIGDSALSPLAIRQNAQPS